MQEWSLGLSTGQPSDRSVEERCGGAIAVVTRGIASYLGTRHCVENALADRLTW